MAAEVLVMCGQCGRPQPARPGACAHCGAPLPEAPVPGARPPGEPFARVELWGGRRLEAADGQLKLVRAGPAADASVPLVRLRAARLERGGVPEPLAAAAVGLFVVLLATPAWLRGVGALLCVAGLLAALSVRRYALTLQLDGAARVRWPLGLVRVGGRAERQLLAGGGALLEALRARGVAVERPARRGGA